MTLAGIPEGSTVFIDANVFVYHFVGASAQCTALLARCETSEVRGSTSALVLAEVAHRLMMIEAVKRRVVSSGNVARKLAGRPELVRQLTIYEASIQAISSMGVEIMALTEVTIQLGLRHQRRYGLLTNDSLLSRPCCSKACGFSQRPIAGWRSWTSWKSPLPRTSPEHREPQG